MNYLWMDERIQSFIDEMETEFIKGPWEIDGKIYDYKFVTKDGEEDYCMCQQMIDWNIRLVKVYQVGNSQLLTI